MANIIQIVDQIAKQKYAYWRLPSQDRPVRISEVSRQSTIYAAQLHRLGINQGDKIGIFYDRCCCYLSILLAIWRLNAIAVPLSPRSIKQPRQVSVSKNHKLFNDIKALLYGDVTSEEVLVEWMKVCDAVAYSMGNFERLPATVSAHAAVNNYKTINDDDIAVLKITDNVDNGTGSVVLTHAMLLDQLASPSMEGDENSPECGFSASVWASQLVSVVTLPMFKPSHPKSCGQAAHGAVIV